MNRCATGHAGHLITGVNTPVCETYAGSHRAIGEQIGRRHALWIRRVLAMFVQRHEGDLTEDEYRAMADQWRQDLLLKAPRLLEQLEGISAASGAPMDDLLAMNFRFWNILAERRRARPPADHHCTNVALRDPEHGVLLGGSLDDIAVPWYLARFEPEDGLRHLCVTWIGSAWAGRGINEAGLAIGGSSMPVDGMRHDPARRFDDLTAKLVLEQAHDVDEAIDILRDKGGPYKGTLWLLADQRGVMRFVEAGWPGVEVHEPTDDALYCVNCIVSPRLRRQMESLGYQHQPGPWVHNRRRVIEQCLAAPREQRSRALMEAILRNHNGFPDSICHPNAVYHTIAAPQSGEPGMWVTEGPSCRNPFVFIPAIADHG